VRKWLKWRRAHQRRQRRRKWRKAKNWHRGSAANESSKAAKWHGGENNGVASGESQKREIGVAAWRKRKKLGSIRNISSWRESGQQ